MSGYVVDRRDPCLLNRIDDVSALIAKAVAAIGVMNCEMSCNFEAEQFLLGRILVNNAAYYCVSEFLGPQHERSAALVRPAGSGL